MQIDVAGHTPAGGGQDELAREAEARSPRGLVGHASTSDSLNKHERGPESPR